MNPEFLDGKFKLNPYVPFDPTSGATYAPYTTMPGLGGVQPIEYEGWRDEEMSWHKTCYIHAGLNPFPEVRISGPDATRFLNENLTNSFKNFEVGRIKHAIMVTPEGYLAADGLVIHTAEDEYETTCLNPYLFYRYNAGDYDCKLEDITGDVFFYQLGGPNSLAIVEAATGEDLHDIKFLREKLSTVAGKTVKIRRIGMAGSLAYEVHGDYEDRIPVYEKLLEVGKEFGLVRLGLRAYWNTHTENGFPQSSIHFPYALETDPKFFEYAMKEYPGLIQLSATYADLKGSLGTNPEDRFVNPIELGWERAIDFDKEFEGKEALLKIRDNHRQVVTLEWNIDDVLDIWKSEFEPGEPYAPLDGPVDYDETGHYAYFADKVLCGDKKVGISSGRMHSWYYRKMISLGFIEPEYAEIGTELTVVWGEEGTRQKKIRATVARHPYMNEDRNENVDVNKL